MKGDDVPAKDRPLERPPERLRAQDEGYEGPVDPPRPCRFCGHVVDVARVVVLDGGDYDYACHGCAVKT